VKTEYVCVNCTTYDDIVNNTADTVTGRWSWAVDSRDVEPLHRNAYSLVIRTTYTSDISPSTFI